DRAGLLVYTKLCVAARGMDCPARRGGFAVTQAVLDQTTFRSLPAEEFRAPLRDGAEVFYRAWLPPRPTDKAVLLFHRGHEHSGRYAELVERLGLNDAVVFAWDQRG